MYVSTDNFIKEISRSFLFLVDFGFKDLGYELSPSRRGYYYFFSKAGLTIRIHYSLTNDWIDVDYVFLSDARNVIANWDNSTSLMSLFFHNGIVGYESIMPNVIGFEKSVQTLAEKTKQISEDILKGHLIVKDNDILKRR